MDDTGRRIGGRRGESRPQPRRPGRPKPPDWPVNGDEHTPEGASGFEGGWFDKPPALDDRPKSAFRPNGHANGPANGHRISGSLGASRHGSVNGGRSSTGGPASTGRRTPVPKPTKESVAWPEFDQERFANGQTDPGPFSRVPFEPRTAPKPGSTPRSQPESEQDDDLYAQLYAGTDDETVRREPVAESDGRDEPRKRRRKLPFWIELPALVVVALLFTFLIQTFVARVYVIPSGSMEQTLIGNNGTGDRILVDKVVYDFHSPRPGDVIVFKGPPGWEQTEFFTDTTTNPIVGWLRDLAADIGVAKPNEYDLVKRVIAVGGQTVSCCDKENRTVVDGKPLTEPYIYWQPGRPPPDQQLHFGPITIPQGYVWVEGDNRNNSDDSRYQNGGGIHGVVPVSDVIGKARTIIWPPSRWRGIGDNDPQTVADPQPSWGNQLSTTGVGALATLPTFWLGRRRSLIGLPAPRRRARRGVRRHG